MTFEEIATEGKCDVCGKETLVVVSASSIGPISYAYCEECLVLGLEPYDGLVATTAIACAMLSNMLHTAKYPDDFNEDFVGKVRRTLEHLGISEEHFILNVRRTLRNSYEELGLTTERQE